MWIRWRGKAVGVNRWLETNRRGVMYKNPEYAAFQDELIYYLKLAKRGKKTMTGGVMVVLHFVVNPLRDIDSLEKPILDSLEKSGVIENDRQVVGVSKTKSPKKGRKDLDQIQIVVTETDKEKSMKTEMGEAYPDNFTSVPSRCSGAQQ